MSSSVSVLFTTFVTIKIHDSAVVSKLAMLLLISSTNKIAYLYPH
jgi:hypothetical protein